MKNSLLLILICLICFSSGVVSQEKSDPFVIAVGEKDPQKKLQKLETYFFQYQDNPGIFNKNVFLHIVDLAMFLEKYEKVIQFGERGLRWNWNKEIFKLNLYLNVARAYVIQDINLDKAYNYAEHVIRQTPYLDEKDAGIEERKQLSTLAVYIQLQILEGRSGVPQAIREGLQKSLEAYRTQKTERAADYVFLFSRRYYLYYQDKDTAISALDFICNEGIRKQEYLKILALWYSKNQNKEKATEYLKTAYSLKRDAGIAYSIGKLLQSDNPGEGILYLSESFLLNETGISEKAEQLLLHLYFNVVAVNETPEKQETGYAKIIQDALSRLGSDGPAHP